MAAARGPGAEQHPANCARQHTIVALACQPPLVGGDDACILHQQCVDRSAGVRHLRPARQALDDASLRSPPRGAVTRTMPPAMETFFHP